MADFNIHFGSTVEQVGDSDALQRSTKSKKYHPMWEIPEIRTLITSHLPRRDMAALLIVNKTMFATVMPLLYKVVTYYSFQGVLECPGSEPRHRIYNESVRHLWLRGSFPLLTHLENIASLFDFFPNLQYTAWWTGAAERQSKSGIHGKAGKLLFHMKRHVNPRMNDVGCSATPDWGLPLGVPVLETLTLHAAWTIQRVMDDRGYDNIRRAIEGRTHEEIRIVLEKKWQYWPCIKEALLKRYPIIDKSTWRPNLHISGAAGDGLFTSLESLSEARFPIHCEAIFEKEDEEQWEKFPERWEGLGCQVNYLSLRVPHDLLLRVYAGIRELDRANETADLADLPHERGTSATDNALQAIRHVTSPSKPNLQHLELVISLCQFDLFTSYGTIETFTRRLVPFLTSIGGEDCKYSLSVYDTEQGSGKVKGENNRLVGTIMMDVWRRIAREKVDVELKPVWTSVSWPRVSN